jgi:hypothetical protein
MHIKTKTGMRRFEPTILIIRLLLWALLARAQEYVYPNKRLADQGLIEYRRCTFEEARACERASPSNPWLITGWGPEKPNQRGGGSK